MSTLELQNRLIRRILEISDQELLEYLFNITGNEKVAPYQLTPFEKQFIQESIDEYSAGKVMSNEEVTVKTDQWLHE
jgi:hypothetical protein